jgi:excisionase family DNA binding protein
MAILLDGQKFYTTTEACKLAGTNRDTLLRWIREKKFDDVRHRDRNGWRLFTEQDMRRLKERVNRIIDVNISLENLK